MLICTHGTLALSVANIAPLLMEIPTNPPHFVSRLWVAHLMRQYLVPCDHDDGFAVYIYSLVPYLYANQKSNGSLTH